ncbi:MAG: hypothetical protein JNL70_15215 [Saprospiraceae bacterium]|nr:hypothetical protein [Saprospiraceae bacterium]
MNRTHAQPLLILAYFYPPIKSIAVLRTYYFSQFVKNYFSDIYVITTTNRNRLPAENMPITEGVQIHEAITFDYRTLSTLRKRQSVSFEENSKANPLVQFLVKLNKSFPTNLLWGEGGLIYSIHAFFVALKLIRKHKIQTIYSSFSPYSDHIVAYWLKIFYPKLTWVADFRDLHVEPHYDIVYWRPFQHWCNRQILKKADLVTTVSTGLSKHLKDYHSNVYVFQNGIAPLSILDNKNDSQPTKFTICYTGSMYADERNPQLLLTILKELVAEGILTHDNFQFVYAGKDTQVWFDWMRRFDLEPHFKSLGLVALSKAQELQRTSHLNLLLTTATPQWTGVMTGKFYEYLAALQPILVLINGSQDIEFEEIMMRLNAGCVAYNDRSHSELRAFVLMLFYQFQKTGQVERMIHTEKLKELEWGFTVNKLMSEIEKVRNSYG